MNKESLSFTLLFLGPCGDKLGGHWDCTLSKLRDRVGEYMEAGYTMEKIYYNVSKDTQVLIYEDGTWLLTLSMFR